MQDHYCFAAVAHALGVRVLIMKKIVILSLLLFSHHSYSECFGRAEGVYYDSEFAYEVKTFGEGYRGYSDEIIEPIKKHLIEIDKKVNILVF